MTIASIIVFVFVAGMALDNYLTLNVEPMHAGMAFVVMIFCACLEADK